MIKLATILLLEDDKMLSTGIQIALQKDHHKVIPAYSFFEGVEKYTQQQIDLFLLDIQLPDGNGLMFCKKIRETVNHPIIFLTANDTEQDMLAGYQAGCDDYMTKPFSIEVLRQKVMVVLRRFNNGCDGPHLFQYKDLEVNFDRMLVTKKGEPCKLTATEYKLLEYMIINKGKVLTRAMLLEKNWDIDGNYIDENTLSVYVRRLRQKLEDDPKHPEYIHTVFGIGYTFGT